VSPRTKREIEQAGRSGLALSASDVMRWSRKMIMHEGRRVRANTATLRHAWPDNVDAPLWDAIRRVFLRAARERADVTGCVVEVYSADGSMLEQIEPSAWGDA
jgi:hypothetical protein